MRGKNSDQFYLEGDQFYDNISAPYTYNFNTNHNHTFQNTPLTTMKLTSRWENPAINTYYIDGNSNWTRAAKLYTITTGTAISKNVYKYGFFEARFKVNRPPGAQCKGLGQCFWLYADYNNYSLPPGVSARQTEYSEIDIAENDPFRGLMTSNYWFKQNASSSLQFDRNVDDCNYGNTGYASTSHADTYINQTEWHTYSLEWTPTEMNTYYDNKLVKHMEYPANLFDPMNIILDIEGALYDNGDKFRFCSKIIPGITNLPFDFELDFIKIYKLNTIGCTTSFVQSNYNFVTNSYNYGLKKLIHLGQNNLGSASVKISLGQKISLRAVEYIQLEDGFEVDDATGTEFFATTNGTCDNQ